MKQFVSKPHYNKLRQNSLETLQVKVKTFDKFIWDFLIALEISNVIKNLSRFNQIKTACDTFDFQTCVNKIMEIFSHWSRGVA